MSDQERPKRPLIDGLDPRQLFSEAMVDTTETLPNIAGFQVRSKLGEGGMGTVYRAWQDSLGREVALKLVRPSPDSDTAVFERLEREARAMASIEHPHIVEVYDFLQLEDGSAVIAMKLIEGETLRTLMERHSAGLPFETIKRLVHQIGEALHAAHLAGMVHRDVKPENVLIDLQGNALVTDFGLALPIDEASTRLTLTGTSVGTLAYIAPEQMEGQTVDAKADQFSFGVLIYEMLTAVRPRGVIEPPQQLRKDLNSQSSNILLKAISRKPSERWTSVQQLVNQISPTLQSKRAIPRRKLLTTGFIGGGLAILGGVGYHYFPDQNDWVDLLTSTDLSSAYEGSWTRSENILTSRGYSMLPLPVAPDELGDQYEVILEISQGEYMSPYGICFQTREGMLALDFNHWSQKGLSGIHKINGVMLDQGAGVHVPMQPNEICRFRLVVRTGEVAFYRDGQLIKSYPMRPGERTYNFWRWPEDKPQEGLALVSQDAPSKFHRVAWRKIEE